MIKESIEVMIALFFAFILKAITYAVANFYFTGSPLFSLNFSSNFINEEDGMKGFSIERI